MALRDTLEAILREYDSAKPEAARRYCHTRVSTQLPSKPRPPANMATRNMPLFAILTSQARHI
jgi:hypothetical protein